jgi:hypothetical protein
VAAEEKRREEKRAQVILSCFVASLFCSFHCLPMKMLSMKQLVTRTLLPSNALSKSFNPPIFYITYRYMSNNFKAFPANSPNLPPPADNPNNPPNNTATAAAAAAADHPHNLIKTPIKSKFQLLWHRYGVVSVGTYLSIYVTTLMSFYVGFEQNLFGSIDIINILHKLGLEGHLNDMNSKHGNFALAWITTKLTEPIRLALTVGITPKIAKLVGTTQKYPNHKELMKQEKESKDKHQ